MRRPPVLVIQVVGVFPDVEGKEGAERFLDFALRASLEMTEVSLLFERSEHSYCHFERSEAKSKNLSIR